MRQSSGQNLLISVRVFSRAENKKQHNYCRLQLTAQLINLKKISFII